MQLEAIMTDYYDNLESDIIFSHENSKLKGKIMSENNKNYKRQFHTGVKPIDNFFFSIEIKKYKIIFINFIIKKIQIDVSQFDASPSHGPAIYGTNKKPRSTKKKGLNNDGTPYNGDENVFRRIKKL